MTLAAMFLIAAACSPEGTVVTTAITITAPPTTATTSGDETTGGDTDSATAETIEPTTGGPDLTTSTASTTTGADWPEWCLPDPEVYLCPRVPVDFDFCKYVADACEIHEIGGIYCEIAVDKCLADEERCATCFWLANTCVQIGSNCDDLMNECACAAFGG